MKKIRKFGIGLSILVAPKLDRLIRFSKLPDCERISRGKYKDLATGEVLRSATPVGEQAEYNIVNTKTIRSIKLQKAGE